MKIQRLTSVCYQLRAATASFAANANEHTDQTIVELAPG